MQRRPSSHFYSFLEGGTVFSRGGEYQQRGESLRFDAEHAAGPGEGRLPGHPEVAALQAVGGPLEGFLGSLHQE